MNKIFSILFVLIAFTATAQNKIVIHNNALTTAQDTMYRTLGKDSIQFKINGRYHAILDSAGGAVTAATDTLYRTVGKDSIQFTIGGRYHAILDSAISSNQATSSLGCTVDGQGGIITTGSKGFVTIPYSCTITNWYVSADVSGTIQFDIKRSSTSIIGTGNKPALSTQISANAAANGSWTSTAIAAGDIIEWVVDSSPAPATVTNVTLVLKVTK